MCFPVNFAKFLRTPSEIVTESTLGNSVRGEKLSARDQELHIISFFSTGQTELRFSTG